MEIKYSPKRKKELISKGKALIKNGKGYLEAGKLMQRLGEAEIDYANGVNYLSEKEFLDLHK